MVFIWVLMIVRYSMRFQLKPVQASGSPRALGAAEPAYTARW